MFETIKYRRALKRLMKDHRVLRQNYEKIPDDPTEPSNEPRYKHALGREITYQTQAIEHLRSKYLVEQAYKYHVPTSYDKESWIQPRGAPEAFLTTEAAHKLQLAIRAEQKAVWEFWQTRLSLILSVFALVVALLGYLKK
jgi:hypothetical protein